MPTPQETWSNLSSSTAQVLICDLQQQIVARSKTTKPEDLSQSAEVLCKIAQLFELPLTLSVVPENNEKPKLIPQLNAFATPGEGFLRSGASPLLDEKTKSHLAELKRPTILLAGFATEVVVLHAALHALEAGYGVIVLVDACGGQSDRTEHVAFQQIENAGGVLSSVVSVATALSPDFTTKQGQEMFGIVQTLRLA